MHTDLVTLCLVDRARAKSLKHERKLAETKTVGDSANRVREKS
jgi:hypothetical protein